MRDQKKVALIGVDGAFEEEDPASAVDVIDAGRADPGLATLTPDRRTLLVYTSLAGDLRPSLGVLDLESESHALRAFGLRNQIRSVAPSPDSSTAVVVHKKQDGPPASDADPLEFFRHNHGLTIVDLATGYRRPVTLQGDPARIVMTSAERGEADRTLLFAMLRSPDPEKRGLMRIDLSSYRTDFLDLPRPPDQLGLVAGKVFVSQESDEGRITFFDLASGERQTVSGYELNAGIR